MNAIATTALCKQYANKNVVNKLELQVPEGAIYGFIGRNGAGKSTTQKMICGLTPITSGNISLFDKPVTDANIRSKVGMLIENAGVYPALTAQETMRLYALAIGLKNANNEIGRILTLMGIGNTGNKKVKQFSLGMKQRLGIAIALLGNPKLLILDEPINGLDPQGIIEFREIILKLNKQYGMTIFISSHILGELAKISTHYGVIREGEMVKQMSAKQLDEICQNYMQIKLAQPEKAVELIRQSFNVQNIVTQNKNEIQIFGLHDTKAVNTMLYKNGIEFDEIYMHKQDLEEYFMKLMGGAHNG